VLGRSSGRKIKKNVYRRRPRLSARNGIQGKGLREIKLTRPRGEASALGDSPILEKKGNFRLDVKEKADTRERDSFS